METFETRALSYQYEWQGKARQLKCISVNEALNSIRKVDVAI